MVTPLQEALRPRRSWPHPETFVLIILLSLIASCTIVMMIDGNSPPLGTQCVNNMKQVALAILKYEAKHGHLPPAYVADASGKPMHSWRVGLLVEASRS
jgi:hypothetical protein